MRFPVPTASRKPFALLDFAPLGIHSIPPMTDPTLISHAELWLWTFGLALAAGAAFYFGFRLLRRARLIEDTPSSMIRSAHQGYVELQGWAEPLNDQPLNAPLSGRPCCWFSFAVHRRRGKDWSLVEQGRSRTPFLLRDGTGFCLVDPQGAEVTTQKRRTWYGHQPRPCPASATAAGTAPWLELFTRVMHQGEYRYREEIIDSGRPLYALGEFRSRDALDQIAVRERLTRELLREWKRDSAGLLARFDLNGDGRIDAGEWEQAVVSAREAAAKRQPLLTQGEIPLSLRRPEQGTRPYILSTKDQAELARQLRIWAGLALVSFFLAAAAATSLLSRL